MGAFFPSLFAPGLPHQLPIWDASSESGLRALGKGEFGYLGALAE